MPLQSPTTFVDGGFAIGSYDITVAGYGYTMQTVDQDLPVAQSDAMKADGTPKGGAFVIGKQKVSVKIQAITGIPAPQQLVPFSFAFHNYPAAWWIVANLKISSSNTAAQIRTYSADMVYLVNPPS